MSASNRSELEARGEYFLLARQSSRLIKRLLEGDQLTDGDSEILSGAVVFLTNIADGAEVLGFTKPFPSLDFDKDRSAFLFASDALKQILPFAMEQEMADYARKLAETLTKVETKEIIDQRDLRSVKRLFDELKRWDYMLEAEKRPLFPG